MHLENKDRLSAGVCQAPQRLNAKNHYLAYIVGFVEVDGWFVVTQNGVYLAYEMGIELHRRDKALLLYIQSLLNVGHVVKLKKGSKTVVRYRVRKKSDLKRVILPLFEAYPMLTPKLRLYEHFKHVLNQNLVTSTTPEHEQHSELKGTLLCPTALPCYFGAWLVGFIEAEGCFRIYSVKRGYNKTISYPVAAFSIDQKNAQSTLKAIKTFFNASPQVRVEGDNYYTLALTSAKDIRAVVTFFELQALQGVKLRGVKANDYANWLEGLRYNGIA